MENVIFDIASHKALLDVFAAVVPLLNNKAVLNMIFIHTMRITRMVCYIIQDKPQPELKETPQNKYHALALDNVSNIIGNIDTFPSYLAIWTQLADSYRISLGSFDGDDIYFKVTNAAWKCVLSTIRIIDQNVLITHINEIMEYIQVGYAFERNLILDTCRLLFSKCYLKDKRMYMSNY